MNGTAIRVLLVDDYRQWRHICTSELQKLPEIQIIGEACDGLEAVQMAEQHQPDLILLDIGLPNLDGLEASRRIRAVSTNSRVLFVSEHRTREIAEEALSTGAYGYVIKSCIYRDLLSAVVLALRCRSFISAELLPRKG